MMHELEDLGGRRPETPPASQDGTMIPDITTDTGGVSHTEEDLIHPSHDGRPPSVVTLTSVVSAAQWTRPRVDNVTVKRKLRSMDLFMITINGTLGTGLYMRSGQIIQLAGPVAVITSFIVLGFLVWTVMQCMTELLCIWPVPGALPLFVRKFVDQELGIAVGVTYWFTYSVSFGALIASAASILNYWTHNIPGVTVGIIYVTLPIVLVCVNMLEIGRYGLFEAVTGTVKLFFLILILVGLLVIYTRESISENTKSSWESDLKYDEQAASGYFSALMMCFSIATFAYTGVEIIAASAIEARWPKPPTQPDQNEQGSSGTAVANDANRSAPPTPIPETPQPAERSFIYWPFGKKAVTSITKNPKPTDESFRDWPWAGNIIKFTAGYGPIFVAVAYTLSGLMVSLGLYQGHKELSKLSWIKDQPCKQKKGNQTCERTADEDRVTSLSPFIIVARASDIPGLDHVFNAFILFTALTCANTNLYVASRTLFGMAKNVHGTHWALRWFSYFGKTDKRFVPLRAVIISAVAFCWVPLLQIPEDFHKRDSLGAYVETLAQMGSVSIVVVWACQCLAYIRFYNCTKKHESALEQKEMSLRQQQEVKSPVYPFRSYLQPFLAYVAFCGCLFILVVCNGAFLWKGFYTFPFLSAYLTPIVFLAVWLMLKVCKGFPRGLSFLVDLDEETTIKAIRELNQACIQSMEPVESSGRVGTT